MLRRDTRLWFLVLLGACSSPETSDLVGTWANLDDEDTWRVWVFDEAGTEGDLTGLSHVYRVFMYADGATPVEVQRGTYAVTHGTELDTGMGLATFNDVLQTSVVWSADGVVQAYADPIYAFTNGRMTLRSASAATGRRAYVREDELP